MGDKEQKYYIIKLPSQTPEQAHSGFHGVGPKLYTIGPGTSTLNKLNRRYRHNNNGEPYKLYPVELYIPGEPIK